MHDQCCVAFIDIVERVLVGGYRVVVGSLMPVPTVTIGIAGSLDLAPIKLLHAFWRRFATLGTFQLDLIGERIDADEASHDGCHAFLTGAVAGDNSFSLRTGALVYHRWLVNAMNVLMYAFSVLFATRLWLGDCLLKAVEVKLWNFLDLARCLWQRVVLKN